MDWLKNFRSKFIEQCNHWWKLWSSWLALIWGLIVTAFWNQPEVLQEITNALPESYRAALSPLVFAVVAGLPILVRLLKQQKLEQQWKDQNK